MSGGRGEGGGGGGLENGLKNTGPPDFAFFWAVFAVNFGGAFLFLCAHFGQCRTPSFVLVRVSASSAFCSDSKSGSDSN